MPPQDTLRGFLGRTLPSQSRESSPAFALYMQTTVACATICVFVAQQQQKPYYDKRHMPAEIAIGPIVLLATTNMDLKTVVTRKVIHGWKCWAFRVTRSGCMSYCLDLPACMHQIHIVLHIFLIKRYRSVGQTQPPQPP